MFVSVSTHIADGQSIENSVFVKVFSLCAGAFVTYVAAIE